MQVSGGVGCAELRYSAALFRLSYENLKKDGRFKQTVKKIVCFKRSDSKRKKECLNLNV